MLSSQSDISFVCPLPGPRWWVAAWHEWVTRWGLACQAVSLNTNHKGTQRLWKSIRMKKTLLQQLSGRIWLGVGEEILWSVVWGRTRHAPGLLTCLWWGKTQEPGLLCCERKQIQEGLGLTCSPLANLNSPHMDCAWMMDMYFIYSTNVYLHLLSARHSCGHWE